MTGYTLQGHKCIAHYQILFSLLLNGNLDSDFTGKLNKFKSDFVDTIGGDYVGKPHLLSGKVIKQGSVNYEFLLSVINNDTRFELLDKVDEVAMEGSTYNGIEILTSQNIPNY